jgi:hypothetical protein
MGTLCGSSSLVQVNFFAREGHESLANYKLLQATFTSMEITRVSKFSSRCPQMSHTSFNINKTRQPAGIMSALILQAYSRIKSVGCRHSSFDSWTSAAAIYGICLFFHNLLHHALLTFGAPLACYLPPSLILAAEQPLCFLKLVLRVG